MFPCQSRDGEKTLEMSEIPAQEEAERRGGRLESMYPVSVIKNLTIIQNHLGTKLQFLVRSTKILQD